MTDKERLEEIKQIRNDMEEYMNPDGSVEDYSRYDELALFIIDDYLDYLIKQAERVQNLKEIKNNAINQIDVTQERNKRLEERVRDLEKNIEQEYNNHKDLESGLLRQNKCYREAIERIKKYANDCIDEGVEMNPHLVLEDIKELEEYYNE